VSKLRNRVIGRVFHELGLIEQWGSGIQRMTAACRDAGLAPPMLEEIGTRFRVTIHTTPTGAPSVDKTDQAILDTLAAGNGLSTQEIATVIGLTARATRSRLLKLVEHGLVREIGTSLQDPKRRNPGVFRSLIFHSLPYTGHLSELETRSLHEKCGGGGRNAFGWAVGIIQQGQNP
jgi:DNA-binding transcriptional ArsR family regulator